MVQLYYIVFAMILILTLPMASDKIAFAHETLERDRFAPLGGVNKYIRVGMYVALGVVFAMLLMVCVSRSELLPDYQMYKNMYYGHGYAANGRHIEPSFVWLCQASPSFMSLLLAYALLSVGTHFWGILRNSPNLWLSMFLYVGMYFVLHDMIQMRASVSAGILLIAVRYIPRRRWYVYFPLVALAILFHSSAVVFIPLFFLPAKRMYRPFWMVLLGVCLIVGLSGVQLGKLVRFLPLEIVNNYLISYGGERFVTDSTVGPIRIFMVIVLMIMVYYLPQIQKRYPLATVCVGISICSQACFLLLGGMPVMPTRLGELLGTVDILTLAAFPLISRKYYYALLAVPIAFGIYNAMTGYVLLTSVA